MACSFEDSRWCDGMPVAFGIQDKLYYSNHIIILQGTNISHQREKNHRLKSALGWAMLVPRNGNLQSQKNKFMISRGDERLHPERM